VQDKENTMIKKIREIVIAVEDIEAAAKRYSQVFGLEPAIETIEEEGMKACSFSLGETGLYLISPERHDSPVDKFLKNKGEGIFGISLEVTNIEKDAREYEERGLEFSYREPKIIERTGERYLWTRPKSMHGVAFEIAQFPAESD